MILHVAAAVASGVQFDTTISVGNLITLLSIAVLGVVAWTKLGGRVDTMGDHISTIEKWIEIHQTEVDIRERIAQELKLGVGLLNQSMVDLNRRLEAQEFSANRERRSPRNKDG